MRYIVSIKSIWECGKRVDAGGNPHQEDSIFPAYGQQKDSDRLFILCDGMGGHDAGEVASATVCEAMSRSIKRSVPDQDGPFSDEQLQKAISDAFDALDAIGGGSDGEKKMGTTMTFLKLHNRGCTIAHIGDSRVYHIRPGRDKDSTQILFQTSDHSLVNDLIKIGELTPEEARTSKQKNVITRAMQPNMDRRPKADVYHSADIKKGDYFYLCSDGMLEQMEDENICFNFSEMAGDDDNKLRILTQATSQNSDNHSAIIVHILDVIEDKIEKTEKKPSVVSAPAPIMAEVSDDVMAEKKEKTKEKTKEGTNAISKRVWLRRFLVLLIFIVFILLWAIYSLKSHLWPKTDGSEAVSDSTNTELVAEEDSPVSGSKADSVNANPVAGSGEEIAKSEPEPTKEARKAPESAQTSLKNVTPTLKKQNDAVKDVKTNDEVKAVETNKDEKPDSIS